MYVYVFMYVCMYVCMHVYVCMSIESTRVHGGTKRPEQCCFDSFVTHIEFPG